MSQHAHARALTICQEEGAPLESAERIMRRLLDAGWHWKPPETFQPEPETGPKAEEQTPEYIEVRTRIQEAKRSGAKCAGCGLNAHPQFGGDGNYCGVCLRSGTTKTTEHEETPDA